LIRALQSGREQEIIIAHGRVPAARLVPYLPKGKRKLRIDDGMFDIPDVSMPRLRRSSGSLKSIPRWSAARYPRVLWAVRDGRSARIAVPHSNARCAIARLPSSRPAA